MVAVALTRDEHTAGHLRRFAAACREAAAARRMLALALVLEGSPRAVAAKTCGMDRQTLRDWVHRYNAAGLDGLLTRREGLGRKPIELWWPDEARVGQQGTLTRIWAAKG